MSLMREMPHHKFLIAGLVAFIIAGLLFVSVVPYLLIQEFGFWVSVSILVVMWLFLYVAMIIGAAIYDVSRAGPRSFQEYETTRRRLARRRAKPRARRKTRRTVKRRKSKRKTSRRR